jgi:hypothetical protein
MGEEIEPKGKQDINVDHQYYSFPIEGGDHKRKKEKTYD